MVKIQVISNHRLLVIWSLLLFILLPVTTSAQKSREEAPPLRERLFFGGSFGLQFGTTTDIEVSPIAGIWLLPRLNVAAGPEYRFYKNPITGRTDIIGGRVYTQFYVIKDLDNIIPIGLNLGFFFHAEDELLSLESGFWKDPPYSGSRFLVNTGLAGVGISQPMGRKASMNMMVLWTLNSSQYQIYGNPEFRISFVF